MRRYNSLLAVLVIVGLLLASCGGGAAPAQPVTVAPQVQPTQAPAPAEPTKAPAPAEPTKAPAPAEPTQAAAEPTKPAAPPTNTPPPTVVFEDPALAGRTRIVWYVGLGAGGDADVIPKEQAWVEKFNQSQTEINLVLQVVHNPESYDTLKTQLAAGTGPDIVGPVGKAGRASFKGAWLDITPLAQKAGFDLSTYDPALIDFTKDEGVLVGIPFALFPSFLYYNKALFDEARLPYPPHKVGEKYKFPDGTEAEWTLDTFAKLAQMLTVDKNGNDATSTEFDPKNIVQFGGAFQFTDARGLAVLFGGGLPIDDNGNAKIPDNWRAAWKWYYDAVWKGHFLPNQDYSKSDLFGKDNNFSSGNVAMDQVHTWYTCCFDMKKLSWDIAVMPSVNGKITAKLHGDTFAILKNSKNPDAAFKVLSQMVVDKDLYDIYGGMPAIPADRPGFFANLDKRAEPNKIDWSVAEEMVKYPDLPNHESGLPNLVKANDLFTKFRTLLDTQPDLDVDKAVDQLQADLDAVFKAAPNQ